MSNESVKRLREIAKAKRANATAKVGRMRRSTGADVSGSDLDPRRDHKAINRYNSIQLRAYIKQLDTFNSRSTGYAATSTGKLIARATVDAYKRLERQYNRRGELTFNQVANIIDPVAGMTIKERRDNILSRTIKAEGDVINHPYRKINRDIRNITSPEALEKLTADMRKRTDKDYLSKVLNSQRELVGDLLTQIGSQELIAEVNGLSDHRFYTLYNETSFMANVSSIYHKYKQMAGAMKSSDLQEIENNNSDIRDFLDWVQRDVPATPQSAKRTTQSKSGTTKKAPTGRKR